MLVSVVHKQIMLGSTTRTDLLEEGQNMKSSVVHSTASSVSSPLAHGWFLRVVLLGNRNYMATPSWAAPYTIKSIISHCEF